MGTRNEWAQERREREGEQVSFKLTGREGGEKGGGREGGRWGEGVRREQGREG